MADAKAYLDSTLLAACLNFSASSTSQTSSDKSPFSNNAGVDKTERLLSPCLNALLDCGLIMRHPNDRESFRPTQLGRAILASALGPVDGMTVFEELSRARRSIVLDTDLHLVYLVCGVVFTRDTSHTL